MTKRLPSVDGMSELSFITNYFFQGCALPPWGMIELSREPLQDVALLYLGLDMFDIVQALLGPKGQRGRRAGRHGRKSGRRRGFPDMNDAIGNMFRGDADLSPLHEITKTKFLFHALDKYEGVAFTAAVIDGITETGFQTLYGTIVANPDICPGLGYLYRRSDIGGQSYTPLAGWLPIGLQRLEQIQGFNSSTAISWTRIQSDFTSAAKVTIWADNGDAEGVQIAFRSQDGTLHDIRDVGTVSDGDRVTVALEHESPAGEVMNLVMRGQHGGFIISYAQLFAFSGTWF